MIRLFCKNSCYYSTVLLFIIVGAFVLFSFSKDEVTLWINAHYATFWDQFFLTIDQMGTLWFCIVSLAFLWIKKGWKTALQALICFVVVMLITQFTKHLLFPGTLRPVLHFEDIANLRLINGVEQLKTESFPSGHTSSAFAIFTFFALTFSHKRWHFLFAFAALSVGYARMYLSQHFVTDVYTGMIIGVAGTTIIYWLMQKYISSCANGK